MNDQQVPAQPKPRSLARQAITLAIVFHVILFIVLGAYSWQRSQANSELAEGKQSQDAGKDDDQSGDESKDGKDVEVKEEDIPLADVKQWEDPLKRELDRARNEAEDRTDEENLDALQQHAERIEKISNPKNVEKMAKTLTNVMQLPERASEPAAEPVAGTFDFDTAQIHDVVRREKEGGQYDYFFQMIDKDGRLNEVEIPGAEGKSTYDKFAMMKKSPLMMSIYRKLVMPLFDQLLNDKRSEEDDSDNPLVIP